MSKIKKFLPFLKISQPNEIKMDMDRFSIELLCPCGLPEGFGDLCLWWLVTCVASGIISDVQKPHLTHMHMALLHISE